MFLIYFSIESTCTTISILLGRIIWRLRYVKDVYYYLFWDTGFNEGKWWHRASFSVKMIGTMVKHGHKFLLLLVSILKEGTCAMSVIKYFEYHLCYRQKRKKRERKNPPPPFFFLFVRETWIWEIQNGLPSPNCAIINPSGAGCRHRLPPDWTQHLVLFIPWR